MQQGRMANALLDKIGDQVHVQQGRMVNALLDKIGDQVHATIHRCTNKQTNPGNCVFN
jgi:stress-induced morphogen